MTKYKLAQSGVYDTENEKHIPNFPGNRDWGEYQKWLTQGNKPDAEFTTAELKEQKIKEIKQKAAQDVLKIAPEWKQRNMLATILELQEKRIDGEMLTEDEQNQINVAKEIWNSIKKIRKDSDEAEANL